MVIIRRDARILKRGSEVGLSEFENRLQIFVYVMKNHNTVVETSGVYLQIGLNKTLVANVQLFV